MLGNLNLLPSILIHNYFAQPQCIILISDSVSPSIRLQLGTILVNVKIESDISEVTGRIFHNFGCQHFILNVDDSSALFALIENEMTKRTERFNLRKYIILSRNHDFNIFNTTAINFVSDILLIHADKLSLSGKRSIFNKFDLEVSCWTHRFSGTIENNKPFMLDKWFSSNGSFLYGNKLFFDKLANLGGRKIRVGTFDYRPYVIIDQKSTEIEYSGTDLDLLADVIQRINASMEIVIGTGFWGRIFRNGSSVGLVGDLLHDRIDIGAAGLYLTNVSAGAFDVTAPYSQVHLTVLVPAPSWFIPGLSPVFIFTSPGWIKFFYTYFILGLAIYLIKYWEAFKSGKLKGNKASKLSLLRDTMDAVGKPLVSQSIFRKQYYFKPLMAVVLLSTMTLVVAYTSILSSMMTKPMYEASVRTVDDFLDSDLQWVGMPGDWMMGWTGNDDEKRIRAMKRFTEAESDKLKEFAKEGKQVLLVERVQALLFIYPFEITDVIRNYIIVERNLMDKYITMVLRKNSILLPVIDKFIRRLAESGMLGHVSRRIPWHETYIIVAKALSLKFGADAEPAAFKMEHFGGAFLILIFGNLVATATFLIEIVLKNGWTNIKSDSYGFLH